MSKRTSRKRSTSEVVFQIMGLVLVGSMIVSLMIVALPGPPDPTPTPPPTWTPIPTRQDTATLPPPSPSATPTPTATEPPVGPEPPQTATEPPTGPELPTATIEPTFAPTLTPTLTATPTITPAGAGPDLIFAVCGDSRDNPEVYRRLLAAVEAGGSQFLLHTGDLVNRGSEEQWQVFRQAMDGFALPFYPVPGNHDGLEGELDGYLAHSGAPAAHYSFDRAPVHLTLADSHNGGIGAEELAWLRQDLSATDQPLKMVFLHHPPFDPDGSDHIMAYGNESFMALMAEQQVAYVFAGHIHAYAQGARDGVVYTITGGAGAPLYSADHPQAVYHYLRVSVRDQEVSIELVEI